MLSLIYGILSSAPCTQPPKKCWKPVKVLFGGLIRKEFHISWIQTITPENIYEKLSQSLQAGEGKQMTNLSRNARHLKECPIALAKLHRLIQEIQATASKKDSDFSQGVKFASDVIGNTLEKIMGGLF